MLAALLVHAQDPQSPVAAKPSPTTTQSTKSAAIGPTLGNGTRIKLKLDEILSSADAQIGQTVKFDIAEEVRVGDVIVVPKGGLVCATVIKAEHKKIFGHCGKVTLSTSLRLADGNEVPLSTVLDGGPGDHELCRVINTVGTIFPIVPLPGKDITMQEGTEVTAVVNGDVPLKMAKFQRSSLPQAAGAPVGTENTTLEITSSPPGAEIELDGNYRGDTPSSIAVPPGDHMLKISKPGYKPWERRIKTTSGSVKIVAGLEQQGQPAESQPKPVEAPSAALPQP
jgi:PEGA domain